MLKTCCELLEEKEIKIAFIESASSGYLTSQFSICKGEGAETLLGGLVCYDVGVKVSVLGLSQDLINSYTAESMPVTVALAQAGKKMFQNADWVIACTGLLKPGGSATPEKPEGTFFIAIDDGAQVHKLHYYLKGTPQQRLNKLVAVLAHDMINLLNQ
ncbi:CinA family protein [Acinetobacter bohemicus]|uniref:CinA family protein n=1 Tax=Acinetobacter lwoffii TaxID=28090 RepID=A0A9D2USV9_ACILW|nr:CinA family protein [Acinetobacter sp. S4397-1]MCO8046229.1 CinA family protein [Acinetobacter sp. S4397-1]HJF28121.1 CinA family protein [Acinetobacter lwoffii]